MTQTYDWEACWKQAKHLLDCGADGDTSKGVERLRDLYERGKYRALGQYFGPDGRLSVSVPANGLLTWDLIHYQLRQELVNLFEKLTAADKRFAPLQQPPYYADGLLSWVLGKCQRSFTPMQVAENSPGIRGTAISKQLKKEFAAVPITETTVLLTHEATIRAISPDTVHKLNLYDTFIALENRKLAEELTQILFSRVVELLKIFFDDSVNVVLSINPMDILTASVNTTNWSSCHVPRNGHAYSTGTISYLCDEVTAIAYGYNSIERRDSSLLEPAPVKSWRQMVYFNLPARSAFHSRHYPSSSSEYGKLARQLSAGVLAAASGADRTWFISRGTGLVQSVSRDPDETPTDPEEMGPLIMSPWSFQDPVSESIRLKDGGKLDEINAGAARVPCLKCGEFRDDQEFYCDDDENTASTNCLSCRHCDGEKCKVCNMMFHKGKGVVTAAGIFFCESCAEGNVWRCGYCDDQFENDDLRDLNNGGPRVCISCYETHYFRCSGCGHVSSNRGATTVYVHGVEEAYCGSCQDRYVVVCARCHVAFSSVQTPNSDFCANCSAEDERRAG